MMSEFKNYIKDKILLAPMAGVTDRAFRCICKKMGADLTNTEMVSVKALQFKNKRTKKLLRIGQVEKPVGIQIFGSEPDVMADIAKELAEEYGDDIKLIDINMGCPAPKITGNGEGCALMKDPKLAGLIINKVKNAIDKPLTVKFRKGYDDNSINAEMFAKICEDNGADAITIHGRTRQQFYSGKADWDIIKKIKASAKIPVIGNGDIFSGEDAKNMFEMTGVDAVMVARGCMGNPFIFREIKEYLKTGITPKEPSVDEKLDTLLFQAKQMIEDKGERMGIIQLRKHGAWYIKGMNNATKARERLVKVNTFDELCEVIKTIKLEN
jgi:tRNA-dihydrouridine synthase B